MDAEPINHIEILHGRARIAGKYFKVHVLIDGLIRGGVSIEDMLAAHEDLTRAEIHAALAYYYDNQAWMDAESEEMDALLKEIAIPSEQLLAKMKAHKNLNDS